MYEQHFGLKKAPFPAQATGADVFVGPQTANTMSGLKKALLSQDAVVTVSGPAGSGKTTLVGKALDALSGTHRTVRIGRMPLQGADALEFLLEELGVTQLPKGPIRQFAALRLRLSQLESDNTRLVIVVEDALRAGAETIAELEALTAADAGDSSGAAIVLMGDERLGGFCKDPQLARLDQRIRHRQIISPLSAAELRGFLMHCFRLAGADFEHIFDDRAAELLHQLGEGFPRITRNIVEAALAAASAAGMESIPAAFVADVAREEFGLEALDFDPNPVAPLPEAVVPAAPVEDVVPVADEEIPELPVDDELQVSRDSEPVKKPAIVISDETSDEIPVITESVAAFADDAIPDWERDPTYAELKPDLDALEKAMAFAHGGASDTPDLDASVQLPEPEAQVEKTIEEIPEITLDNAIEVEVGRQDKQVDQPGQIGQPESPTPPPGNRDIPDIRIAPREAEKADAQLEKIASELAKAKTIEDVDEELAETLFGEGLSLVAAQVVAAGSAEPSANDGEELSLFDTAAVTMAQPTATTQAEVASFDVPDLEVSLETREKGGEAGGLDLSASQRLKTVQALNADTHLLQREPGTVNAADMPVEEPQRQPAPESIEDQIITTMTETLKALDVTPPVTERDRTNSTPEIEAPDDKKSGFFSRFKRS